MGKQTGPQFVMERKGCIQDMDCSFDTEYWQRQGSTAIFAAAWQNGGRGASLEGRQ